MDYGTRRIGLAVSIGVAPRLLPHLRESDAKRSASAVASCAVSNLCDEIVLGLPLNSRGEEGEQAAMTLKFAKLLVSEAPSLRLVLIDERFTSQEADAYMLESVPLEKHAELRDSVAAATILQRYFADGNGEVQGKVYYTPPPITERKRDKVEGDESSRMTFDEWRKSQMEQAAANLDALPKRGKKKKKGRKYNLNQDPITQIN